MVSDPNGPTFFAFLGHNSGMWTSKFVLYIVSVLLFCTCLQTRAFIAIIYNRWTIQYHSALSILCEL